MATEIFNLAPMGGHIHNLQIKLFAVLECFIG